MAVTSRADEKLQRGDLRAPGRVGRAAQVSKLLDELPEHRMTASCRILCRDRGRVGCCCRACSRLRVDATPGPAATPCSSGQEEYPDHHSPAPPILMRLGERDGNAASSSRDAAGHEGEHVDQGQDRRRNQRRVRPWLSELELIPWDEQKLAEYDAVILLDTQPNSAYGPLPKTIKPNRGD